DLSHLAPHEDELEALIWREVAQKYRHHFESFAARFRQPGTVLSDRFHLFELVISLWIVEVGAADIVGRRFDTACLEHFSHQRRAGAWKPGDDGNFVIYRHN